MRDLPTALGAAVLLAAARVAPAAGACGSDADEADLHLPLLPGTDVVLAYAVAALLQAEGGLDESFISRHGHGAGAGTVEQCFA